MDQTRQNDRDQSPPRRQRACEPCSAAKARCHFQDANVERHVCDRCQKMKIKCSAKASKSLRKTRQIKPLGSRVLYLEKKIEDLTSVLENRNRVSPPETSSNSSAPGVSRPELFPDLLTPESGPPAPPAPSAPFDKEFCWCIDQSHHAQPRKLVAFSSDAPFGFTWRQATRILAIFRERYMPNFPYVVIKEDVSAQQLCEMKPFLFRVVMLAAAPVPVRKTREMKDEVLSYLGQRMLVENERTLDLLQGLLVCVAWADLNSLIDQQITNLTYLALGFAHNMNMTRIPIAVLEQIGMDDGPDDLRRSKKTKMVQKVHSTDEQRAYLGTLCILSVNGTSFGRQNPLKGQYVDMCCDSLKRIAEHPSDFILERTIRMIQIGDRISEMFGAANDREREKPYAFLVEEHAAEFRAELDAIMDSTKPHHFQDALGGPSSSIEGSWREMCFKLQYNSLLVRLYEPSTYLTGSADEGSSGTYRVACLQSCLSAAKTFFDTFLELPVSRYLYQCATTVEQITFVMVITTRLLLINTAGWDLVSARQTMDFPSLMGKLMETLQGAEKARKADTRAFAREMGIVVGEEEIEEEGFLIETLRKSMWIREWFIGKIKRGAERRGEGVKGGETGGTGWDGADVVDATDAMRGVDGISGWAAFGGAPVWFSGLLSNSAWNFDGV